ncbi:MAG: hypothetical protein R2758_09820 [Bacteroidales bacterium]
MVLARRKGASWFIAGVNAEKEPVKLSFSYRSKSPVREQS